MFVGDIYYINSIIITFFFFYNQTAIFLIYNITLL